MQPVVLHSLLKAVSGQCETTTNMYEGNFHDGNGSVSCSNVGESFTISSGSSSGV